MHIQLPSRYHFLKTPHFVIVELHLFAFLVQANLTGSTLLIAHTTALPMLATEGGDMHEHVKLGRRPYVVQLNVLMRELITQQHPNWHLVDLELMTAQFWPPNLYLRDAHHPLEFVTLNLFNIYLNLRQGFCRRGSLC